MQAFLFLRDRLHFSPAKLPQIWKLDTLDGSVGAREVENVLHNLLSIM